MDYLQLLYHAKINIPKACVLAGRASTEVEWERMKVEFREWCLGLQAE